MKDNFTFPLYRVGSKENIPMKRKTNQEKRKNAGEKEGNSVAVIIEEVHPKLKRTKNDNN